ncbi:hypothetical protein PsAD2_03761 [Pseudovibrio axinellae]|uniref:TNT domain-containing protein n=1 Tax=Pseudovibrio axinellae TaxID=989403 RepID=A0A165VL12_9HYPH|nr:TNT domain-containing protein [Pseudovibrio axinellae]KZL14357.1 hypothetical protein PsAD2_03761 [Pseudovibrio axinellae]SER89747.1 Protein of unknown function [Pseudovibrio axinellae]
MLGVKIVARRVSAVASRVVVRVLHQAGKAIPDSGKVLEIDLPDADINDGIIRQVLDEDKLGVGSKSDDAASRAKEKPPVVEEPKGGGNESASSTNRPSEADGKFTKEQLETAEKYGVPPDYTRPDGSTKWPNAVTPDPHTGKLHPRGFLNGKYDEVVLPEGRLIDRYGGDNGDYFSVPGTPFEQRAMAGNGPSGEPRLFKVIKPLPMKQGEIAPWFGQPGGGTQYQSQMPLKKLLKKKYLEELKGNSWR